MPNESFALSDSAKKEMIAARAAINSAKAEIEKAKAAGLLTGNEPKVKELQEADRKLRLLEVTYGK